MLNEENKRITIFTGHYGSGKTEISLNFTINERSNNNNPDITLVDLDFVNPYFRSREAKVLLEREGIKVIASAEEYFNTDLPAFSPKIPGALKNKSTRVIVDLGGDETGARAVGRFRNYIADDEYELFFVVNPYRPYTSNLEEINKILTQIEAVSRLKVTALVSNPNLLKETTIQDITSGHERVLQMAQNLGVPVKFIAVDHSFSAYPEIKKLTTPILKIKRLMLPPWDNQ